MIYNRLLKIYVEIKIQKKGGKRPIQVNYRNFQTGKKMNKYGAKQVIGDKQNWPFDCKLEFAFHIQNVMQKEDKIQTTTKKNNVNFM